MHSIPSQGRYLGCGFLPQSSAYGGQPINASHLHQCFSLTRSLSLPLSLKSNETMSWAEDKKKRERESGKCQVHPPALSWESQKCLQTLQNAPLGAKSHPASRTTAKDGGIHLYNFSRNNLVTSIRNSTKCSDVFIQKSYFKGKNQKCKDVRTSIKNDNLL